MSKRILLLTSTLILISLSVSLIAAPYAAASSPTMWSKTYGGIYNDGAYSVIKTHDGGYAMVGATYSFGSGSMNAWLVKTDADGNMLWNQTYSGLGAGMAGYLIQTDDDGYALVGYTYALGDSGYVSWLVKTDANGNLVWNQTYSLSSANSAGCVVQASDGGYVLVGGVTSSDGTGVDSWLAKTDANGTMQWSKTYDESGGNEMYVLVQASDGGYAVSGYTTSFGAGNIDFWLIKVDSSGNVQWNQTYGGTGNETVDSLIQTIDGGYALGGYSNSFGSSEDFLLVKTDSSGNVQWNQTYGGSSIDTALSGIQTSDGGYALVGVSNSSGSKFVKAWLVKTDSSGNIQWNQTYGGSGENIASSVVQTADAGYAFTGYTNSSGAGGYDFWLVKTDSSGVVPEFPSSFFALAALAALTVLAAVLTKKKRSQRRNAL
jgi:hypothetical protein